MENKYRILWLDDFFENEENPSLPLPLIRKRFPDLDIEPVVYVDKCEEIIKNRINDFQAVILDANGKKSKTPNQEANKIGFEDLIDQIKALNTNIPIYVFSGELSPKEAGDQADITIHNLMRKGFVRWVNLFFRDDTYPVLLDKIKKDLESGFVLLYKYPKIMDNVLNFHIDKEIVCNLLAWIDTKDDSIFPGYLQLRGIVVDYIWNKVFKPFIGVTLRDPNWESITTYCMEPWEKETIKAFKNLANKGVHDGADTYYMREIVANSFIIIMIWYNSFMHKIQENNNPLDYYSDARVKQESQDGNPSSNSTNNTTQKEKEDEGIVTQDNKDKLYIVGSYYLRTPDGENYLGKKVRVVDSHYLKIHKIATKVELLDDNGKNKSSGNTLGDWLKQQMGQG